VLCSSAVVAVAHKLLWALDGAVLVGGGGAAGGRQSAGAGGMRGTVKERVV
jgi:hypothetical protein